jgi:hypothetical protein
MSHVSQESDREGVILPARAVSAGQPPANPLVSARIQHAPSEMNDGFGSARVRFDRGTKARQESPSSWRPSPREGYSAEGYIAGMFPR